MAESKAGNKGLSIALLVIGAALMGYALVLDFSGSSAPFRGALLVVAREPVAQSLRNVWRGLPLLVMALFAGISYLLGKVLVRVLRERFNRKTYMDLRDHPMVQRMTALGWENVLEGKYPQPVFTRKRLQYGVGTAAPPAEGEKIAADGENLD